MLDKQIQSISEAYLDILYEGKEAKFKVGDKVGIGSFSAYGGSGGYRPHDTGIVSAVNKHGHHSVTYDNHKTQMGDNTVPKTEVFDHAGNSRKEYSSAVIIPHDDHTTKVASIQDHNKRIDDMHSIIDHISGKKNGFGEFSKFDKTHAEHLKSLIDKHTA